MALGSGKSQTVSFTVTVDKTADCDFIQNVAKVHVDETDADSNPVKVYVKGDKSTDPENQDPKDNPDDQKPDDSEPAKDDSTDKSTPAQDSSKSDDDTKKTTVKDSSDNGDDSGKGQSTSPSDGKGQSTQTTAPKTGDGSNTALWGLLALIAGSAAFILLTFAATRKKKRR